MLGRTPDNGSQARIEVAQKLLHLQRAIIALLVVAFTYSALDILDGVHNEKRIALEITREEKFLRETEQVTTHLRYALSVTYPERSLSERQRLTLLLQDVRRVRRSWSRPKTSLQS